MANEDGQPDRYEVESWNLNRTCKDFLNDYGDDIYYSTIYAPRLFNRIKELEDQVYILKLSTNYLKTHDDYASY